MVLPVEYWAVLEELSHLQRLLVWMVGLNHSWNVSEVIASLLIIIQKAMYLPTSSLVACFASYTEN